MRCLRATGAERNSEPRSDRAAIGRTSRSRVFRADTDPAIRIPAHGPSAQCAAACECARRPISRFRPWEPASLMKRVSRPARDACRARVTAREAASGAVHDPRRGFRRGSRSAALQLEMPSRSAALRESSFRRAHGLRTARVELPSRFTVRDLARGKSQPRLASATSHISSFRLGSPSATSRVSSSRLGSPSAMSSVSSFRRAFPSARGARRMLPPRFTSRNGRAASRG